MTACAPNPSHPPLHPKPCQRIVQGQVIRPPIWRPDQTRIVLSLQGATQCITSKKNPPLASISGTLYLTVLSSHPADVSQNDIIRVKTTPTPIHEHLNPPDSQHTFSQKGSSLFKALIFNPHTIAVAVPSGSVINPHLNNYRQNLGLLWDKTLSAPLANLARALTLGEASALEADQRRSFRQTGVAHLLAVSGLHVAIVAALTYGSLMFLLVRVRPLSRRIYVGPIGALVPIPVIIAFALLTGAKPPVVRACIMTLFVLVGVIVGRPADGKQALAAAAILIGAQNPSSITDPGFQLSFGAIIGFIVVLPSPATIPSDNGASSDAIQSPKKHHDLWNRICKKTTRLINATLVATAVTTPIVFIHFGEVSLWSIPLNLILIPVACTIVMPPLLFTAAVCVFSPWGAAVIAPYCAYPLQLLWTIIHRFGTTPMVITNSGPHGVLGVLCVCGGIMVVVRKHYKLGFGFMITGIIFFALGIPVTPKHFPKDTLTVDILDVGQGDSTLITFPNQTHWLVDGGGTARTHIGKSHIVPILKKLRIKQIDTMVLTHPDPDHLLGLPAVASQFPIGRLWENGQGKEEQTHPAYAELHSTLKKNHIPVLSGAKLCNSTTVAGVTVEVLHPCSEEGAYYPELNFNNNSLVIKLTYGIFAILLTGDLSAEGELLLLEKHTSINATLLKLGHHGSQTATTIEFLKTVNPKFAVSSNGPYNPYGFPHAQVLGVLNKFHIPVYRTDLHGGIRIIIQKQHFTISRRKK